MSIRIATIEHAPGREIVESLGVVSSSVVAGVSIVSEALASVADIFGARSGALERRIAEARSAAVEDVLAQAGGMGADYIVGLRIDVTAVGKGDQNMLTASVYGTAVRTRPARSV